MRKLILGLIFTFTASFSHAILIQGTFTATITSSEDTTGLFGEGAGDDTLVGTTISGTAMLGPFFLFGPCGTNCADFTFTVDSISLTLENGLTLTTNHLDDSLGNNYYSPWGGESGGTITDNGDSGEDSIDVSHVSWVGPEWIDDYVNDFASFGLYFVDNSGTWLSPEDYYDPSTMNYFDITEDDLDIAKGSFLLMSHGFYYTIDSLQLSYVPVPEPGTALLFIAGLFSLTRTRRKGTQKHH